MGIKLDLWWASIILAVAAGLTSCSGGEQLGGRGGSGGGSGGVGGTGGGEPLAMFPSDFEAAFCAPLVTCAAFPDLATCEAFMVFADRTAIITTVASVGRGTVVYDPVAAAACLAALPQDCTVGPANGFGGLVVEAADVAFAFTSACTGVFTGTVPPGADCVGGYSIECAPSASSCSPANGICNGACCPGVCGPSPGPVSQQPHAVGEDCTDNGACAFPAVCEGTCVLLPGHLAGCNPSAQFPCGSLADYCGVAGGATSPTCLPRVAPGAPCATYDNGVTDPCALEARCTVNDAAAMVCVPYAGLGGACSVAANPCLFSLTCTNGSCVAIAPGMDCGA